MTATDTCSAHGPEGCGKNPLIAFLQQTLCMVYAIDFCILLTVGISSLIQKKMLLFNPERFPYWLPVTFSNTPPVSMLSDILR